MTDGDALLAHLSGDFSSGSENAATKALAYVLNSSASAMEALDDLVRSGVTDVNPVRKVRTQRVYPDGVRPDLVGFEDEDGKRQRVFVEVKFWADLTDKQPVGYLDKLPEKDGPAVLLFLVPDDRVWKLWPILRERLCNARKRMSDIDAERKCMREEGTDRYLMIIGWTSLLDCIAARVRDAGEQGIEADVRQLRGLVQYGSDGIRGQDEEDDRYLRLIIDSATDQAARGGWLSTKGLRRVRRKGRYGRFVRFLESGVTPWFGINDELYKNVGETRLWLRFSPPPPKPKRGLLNQAQFGALREHYQRTRGADYSWVPLDLKPDVEFSVVLDDVLDELQRVSEVLNRVK